MRGRCLVSVLVVALAALAVRAEAQAPAPCGGVALDEAARLVDAGDEGAAAERLRVAFAADRTCAPLAVAYWSATGLAHAVHAATRGGPPDLLAPVEEAVEALAALGARGGVTREAEYAASALRAAAAAAQDERPEMEVWLTHAADLSSRVALAEPAPAWPRRAGVLAGDLWYEVDRYLEARQAYERVVVSGADAYALRGLARSLERLGEVPAACRAYRDLLAWLAARSLDTPAAAEARAYLTRPLCGPDGAHAGAPGASR